MEINYITATTLDIIHPPALYSKKVSETALFSPSSGTYRVRYNG
jgi:hypothetical protein